MDSSQLQTDLISITNMCYSLMVNWIEWGNNRVLKLLRDTWEQQLLLTCMEKPVLLLGLLQLFLQQMHLPLQLGLLCF